MLVIWVYYTTLQMVSPKHVTPALVKSVESMGWGRNTAHRF